MAFDKRQTNIAKGLAVLLLLWHHLFFQDALVLLLHLEQFHLLRIFHNILQLLYVLALCLVI